MTRKLEKDITKARKKLKNAEEKQAVGAEFAGDYLKLQGIKFFKPTFAHRWVLERLRTIPACFTSINDFGVCVTYVLAHEQKDVRNKIMNEITDGKIVKKANDFIMDKEIEMTTIDKVIQKLASSIFSASDKKKAKKKAKPKTKDSSPSGGPE